jgi:hypothetical protein
MARRKSSKKTTRRRSTRRRGIGAINPTNALTQVAGILGGVALAGYANKLLLSKQSSTVQKVAPIVLGVITPMVVKSDLGRNLGNGMIAYGGAKVLQGFGLAGDEMTEEISIGADDLSVIAGDDFPMAGDDGYAMAGDNLAVLAGLEDLDDE